MCASHAWYRLCFPRLAPVVFPALRTGCVFPPAQDQLCASRAGHKVVIQNTVVKYSGTLRTPREHAKVSVLSTVRTKRVNFRENI